MYGCYNLKCHVFDAIIRYRFIVGLFTPASSQTFKELGYCAKAWLQLQFLSTNTKDDWLLIAQLGLCDCAQITTNFFHCILTFSSPSPLPTWVLCICACELFVCSFVLKQALPMQLRLKQNSVFPAWLPLFWNYRYGSPHLANLSSSLLPNSCRAFLSISLALCFYWILSFIVMLNFWILLQNFTENKDG